MSLVDQIKTAMDEVNAGFGNYAQLRELRKQFAAELLEGGKVIPGTDHKLISVDRRELPLLNRNDFPSGTLIRCGKYRIKCDGRKTRAYDAYTLKTVYEYQMPQYLQRFVF